MNCSACRSLLGPRSDGELLARDARLVDAHIASCEQCRAYADRMTALESSLARIVTIEPRPDFTLAVMAKIAAMPAPARQPARLWWLVAADIALWLTLGALTAFGAIRWKIVAAGVAAFAAKAGVALGSLYDVAQHLHITTIVALGVAVEIVFLAVFIAAGRKYLSRLGATLAGVLS